MHGYPSSKGQCHVNISALWSTNSNGSFNTQNTTTIREQRIRELTEFKPGTSKVFFFSTRGNMITDRRVNNIVVLRNVTRFTLTLRAARRSFDTSGFSVTDNNIDKRYDE